MVAFVAHTTIDCANAFTLSEWWKETLGYVDLEGDPNLPGHEECMIRDAENGHRLLFIEVPDGAEHPRKNPLHLDLRPRHGTCGAETAAVLSRGATLVADLRDHHGPGTGWVVLADPEGNEFCILLAESERAKPA
ncbi:VOC family protein [Acidothermaceae bacterium B102]|nr:VOC family protein [Acidothermaceae bacterium B102]